MTTANELITGALQNNKVYAPGEIITDADLALGLSVLNQILEKWQMENIFVTQLTPLTLTLVINKSNYTLGPGGNVNNVRPASIQQGASQASVTISAVTTAVNVVSQLEWTFIDNAAPSTGTPATLWYDAQYPVGQLNVSPTPSAVGTLTFSANFPLLSFPTQTTDALFSFGVREALQDNLGLELLGYFKNDPIDPVLLAKASEGKKFILYQGVTSRAMLGRFPAIAQQGA